jgi:hypothetical protein
MLPLITRIGTYLRTSTNGTRDDTVSVLKAQMGSSSIAIDIKGEAWKMVFPLIFGSVNLVCDPNLGHYKGKSQVGKNGELPKYNVLLSVRDLPEALATELSDDEQRYIFKKFVNGMQALQSLHDLGSDPLIGASLVDLESAIKNLVVSNHHYGASKWSSLQFVEKLIKSRLKHVGVNYPSTHNL